MDWFEVPAKGPRVTRNEHKCDAKALPRAKIAAREEISCNVPDQIHHHGIVYSVVEVGPKLWRWALHPPVGVLGWEATGGVVKGGRGDAVSVAKFEIERQERLATNAVQQSR
jgi:hypothetical protein